MGLINDFKQPTPVKMRLTGYALLGACSTASTFVGASNPQISAVLLVLGFVGKFLTDLFTEPKKDDVKTDEKITVPTTL